MVDDVTLDSMSGGDTVAADDISSVKYQRIKLIHGANGVNDGDVSTANGLPVQDTQAIADNGAFTDGTSKVLPVGYVFDETAGTPLTENDAAAARIDSKRSQIYVLEDGTVRGRRATVDYQGRQVFAQAQDVITVSGNVALTPLRQPINVNSTGAILVSGTTNRRIRVLNGVLMAPTAVTVQLKSANNSDVTGPLPLGATGGFQIPEAEIGDFETRVGESLTIVLSSSVQVGGWLTYVYI